MPTKYALMINLETAKAIGLTAICCACSRQLMARRRSADRGPPGPLIQVDLPS